MQNTGLPFADDVKTENVGKLIAVRLLVKPLTCCPIMPRHAVRAAVMMSRLFL